MSSRAASASSPSSRRHVLHAPPFLVLPVALGALALTSCARAPEAAAFDGKAAYVWVERQVAFGPRTPGSVAHDSCFAMLAAALARSADTVRTDTFTYYSPELGQELRLMNARAQFRPAETRRVLIAAHWDTRPWADRDPDSTNRSSPILGANDGASGVAVILELAERLKRQPPAIGVDLVLFDGEDLGTPSNPEGFFRGSKRYLEWTSAEAPPLFVIVIDMVGRRGASFYYEGHSYERASNIVQLVWGRAKELGVRSFRPGVKAQIADDHVPFLEAGIPAIDVIDLDFPEWHTIRDDLSVIDPRTLEGVGRVLLSLVTNVDFLED